MEVNVRKLSRSGEDAVRLEWSDGHESIVSLKTLRDACPCASCKGETVLFHHYAPPPQDMAKPGHYELKGAEPVGTYALRFLWGDGHNDGIYSWELLRSL